MAEKIMKDQSFAAGKLTGADFSQARLTNVDFSGTELAGADFSHSLCEHVDFSGANLQNVNFFAADLRGCVLKKADIRGADFQHALLEDADLTAVNWDQSTKFFDLYCPKEGAFLGYKKCFNDRLVQLLIPADALRSSATGNTCRCDKAKVLTIKDAEGKSYQEAVSLVDQNFIYRVGTVMEAGNYNPNRWADSTGGIHFFLTPAEAWGY